MANEITWEEVKAVAKIIANDLEAFTETERTLVLEETYDTVKDVYGCPLTKVLRRYRAAHIAANQLIEIAGEGAITSETIGSVTFGKNQPVNNPTANHEELETIYGRRYYDLLEMWRKRNTVSFGVYSEGQILGLPRVISDCTP